MNQTFNIRRFGKYLKFHISGNRWYFGIFALLTIAISVIFGAKMPEHNITPIVVFTTALYGVLMLSVMPNWETTKVSGLGRMISIPASSAEKFASECVVKLAIAVIPFIVLPIFGVQAFPKSTVGWFFVAIVTAVILTTMLLSNFQSQSNNGKASNYSIFVLCVLMVAGGVIPQIAERNQERFDSIRDCIFSPSTVIALFVVSIVLFCLSYYFYKKRNVKF